MREEVRGKCVTSQFTGIHRTLIRDFDVDYSILIGHINSNRKSLESRYDCVTSLRDPIACSISWVNYAVNNHESEQLPSGLWSLAGRLFRS